MIEKIDKIRELLIVPSADEQPKLAINQMKILNLLTELRTEAEQLTIPAVICNVRLKPNITDNSKHRGKHFVVQEFLADDLVKVTWQNTVEYFYKRELELV